MAPSDSFAGRAVVRACLIECRSEQEIIIRRAETRAAVAKDMVKRDQC
jgi:hypothetical protein